MLTVNVFLEILNISKIALIFKILNISKIALVFNTRIRICYSIQIIL